MPKLGRYGRVTMTDSLTTFSELAHRRRSNLRIDAERPVDTDLLGQLIAVAATAPNHYRTYPWRFRIITGAGREGLGESLAAGLRSAAGFDPVADEAKIAKARSKYLRAPVMVVVASRAGDDPVTTLENRDAVVAAVQTLLLAATAAGLASLWSTGAAATSAEVARFCGFDSSDSTIGLIYLGWPTTELDAIVRPEPEIVRIDRA